MNVIRAVVLTAACLLTYGCSHETAPEAKKEEVKKYPLHGQVLRLDNKDKLATIKHEKIGDWMGAMTMDFPVRDDKEFADLKDGEVLDGTVFVQGMDYWLGDIKPAEIKLVK